MGLSMQDIITSRVELVRERGGCLPHITSEKEKIASGGKHKRILNPMIAGISTRECTSKCIDVLKGSCALLDDIMEALVIAHNKLLRVPCAIFSLWFK